MGSCSNKSNQKGVPSIVTIAAYGTVHPQLSSAESKGILATETKTEEIKCNSNFPSVGTPLLFTQVQMPDDNSTRKARKNLTVLTTNADNFEIPGELGNEKSIIALNSGGKPEQGSLFRVKEPVTIGGRPSLNMQSNFEEKLILIQGADLQRDFLLEHGVWVCCKKGLKPESPNQDDFFVIVDNNLLTIGVFDGHGSHGHEISNYIHTILPKLLLSHPSWIEDPLTALAESFPKAHSELINHCNKASTQFDCIVSGCTGTLISIRTNKIYAGHVGDSRAIIAKRSPQGFTSKDLTRDHKPTLPDEMERIQSMGGEVKKLEGDIPHRVFVKGKKHPGIAMSRAFGDAIAQTIGVLCLPEVSAFEIEEDDEFLLA